MSFHFVEPFIGLREITIVEDDFHCSIMHVFHYPFLVNSIHSEAPHNIDFRLDPIVRGSFDLLSTIF